MIRLAKAADIRRMDSLAISSCGFSEEKLMDNAALALNGRMDLFLASQGREYGKTVILCGAGNNGGDGYALAERFISAGRDFDIIAVYPPKSDEAVRRALHIKSLGKTVYSAEHDTAECKSLVIGADTVVDAIFGVGYNSDRTADNVFYRVVRWLRQSNALIISVDMPSGVSSDDAGFYEESSEHFPVCIKADATVTFQMSKVGLESAPGIFYAGEVFTEDIFIPEKVLEEIPFSARLGDIGVLDCIPQRRIDSNKGSYGRLVSFCGSRNMTGAAVLSCLGALSGGVGLMTCLVTDSVKRVVASCVPEVIFQTLPELNEGVIDVNSCESIINGSISRATCLLIGCGIGTDRSARRLILELIDSSQCPIVLDADGINLLCDDIDVFKKHGRRMVLTPHPGEMARLLKTDVSGIQKNRVTSADFFSGEFGSVVVLKGYRTVVSSPDKGIYINPTGNPGMAKAGTGDVLAGLTAGLVAQRIDPFEAAACAAYVHGLAGDMASDEMGEISMRASDLVRYIPQVFASKR